MISELKSFNYSIASGHLTHEARQGQHDDLVMAWAMALWLGQPRRRRVGRYEQGHQGQAQPYPGARPGGIRKRHGSAAPQRLALTLPMIYTTANAPTAMLEACLKL